MIPVNSTYAPLQAFVDELARCGMAHAVTSPGSRNAPLALTLAGDPRLQAVSVLDERSAGFFALGMAKASGRPVAVTCTSGSAAANLLPAVVEAHEARVPLIVLSADRPPELRETGAGQAIDQIKLYGSFAKWFVEVGNLPPGREAAVHFRALACRAWHTALGGRPGVVHLNFPLREPLAPVPGELDPADWEGRPDGGPWVQLHAPAPSPPGDLVEGMAARIRGVARGAIVAGSADGEVAESVAALAAATGWPVLADPLSGLRCGPHDRSHVISHYDVLLRSDAWASSHVPELALRIGDTPTSKPLRAWLAKTAQLVVDPHAVWHEPTRVAETIVQAAPGPLCAAVADAVSAEPDQQWLRDWREADDLVPAALGDTPADFEPRVWLRALEQATADSIIWVASSMPVRDVETFAPSVEKPLRFLSNRGANGIDGTVSSAAGAALATGRPVVLLIGELALLHDIGGLLAARRAGAELTIVCANNGGGGIFDFLPVAGAANRELYEEHILTPAGVDLQKVAALAEIPVIEVRTDRAANVAQHRALFARVAEQLA